MNQNSTNTVIANEINKVFYILLIGLIIGLMSFPVFYFGIYDANKFEKGGTPTLSDLQGVYPNPSALSAWAGFNLIEDRKEFLLKKSLLNIAFVFLISSGLILIIRYTLSGVNWVNKNAKASKII